MGAPPAQQSQREAGQTPNRPYTQSQPQSTVSTSLQPTPSVIPDFSWACSVCTFLNASKNDACCACGSSKPVVARPAADPKLPINSQPAPQAQISSQSVAPDFDQLLKISSKPTPGVSNPSKPLPEWTCSRCTLLNRSTATICSACYQQTNDQVVMQQSSNSQSSVSLSRHINSVSQGFSNAQETPRPLEQQAQKLGSKVQQAASDSILDLSSIGDFEAWGRPSLCNDPSNNPAALKLPAVLSIEDSQIKGPEVIRSLQKPLDNPNGEHSDAGVSDKSVFSFIDQNSVDESSADVPQAQWIPDDEALSPLDGLVLAEPVQSPPRELAPDHVRNAQETKRVVDVRLPSLISATAWENTARSVVFGRDLQSIICQHTLQGDSCPSVFLPRSILAIAVRTFSADIIDRQGDQSFMSSHMFQCFAPLRKHASYTCNRIICTGKHF